jgi:DNA-binding NarL/FixJ family response regulator
VSDPVESLVCDVVEAGVAAVLVRPEVTQSTLTGCVRSAMSGHATLSAGLLETLLEGAANGSRRTTGGLTPRELAVLRLLADGSDTREIAGTLSYSERTVKNVVHDVLMKMNCHNRAHAVAVATRQGII